MSKKSVDKKAVKKFVIESRIIGKTDREIYDELSLIYYDKKTVAMIINGTVTEERKSKNKLLHTLLLVLVGITILFKILIVTSLSSASGKPEMLWLVLLVPIINIFFFVQIFRYDAGIFRLCGILTLVSVFQSVTKTSNGTDLIMTLVLGGGIIGLSFYLGSVLFPGYKHSPDKGADEEYIS